ATALAATSSAVASSAASRSAGVLSFTLARQNDGHWLAVSAQNTDRVPGAQTHLATNGTLVPENYARHRH
ncbi:hypothetical protein, partial [Streptomyces sp. NPDC002082]|uniref:hypothetical protein n=1 Tax=Streptomyces sp. NPDC002082 TaxID=3154772 RepID=UPI003330A515